METVTALIEKLAYLEAWNNVIIIHTRINTRDTHAHTQPPTHSHTQLVWGIAYLSVCVAFGCRPE